MARPTPPAASAEHPLRRTATGGTPHADRCRGARTSGSAPARRHRCLQRRGLMLHLIQNRQHPIQIRSPQTRRAAATWTDVLSGARADQQHTVCRWWRLCRRPWRRRQDCQQEPARRCHPAWRQLDLPPAPPLGLTLAAMPSLPCPQLTAHLPPPHTPRPPPRLLWSARPAQPRMRRPPRRLHSRRRFPPRQPHRPQRGAASPARQCQSSRSPKATRAALDVSLRARRS
mmetsp:Transcript_10010/g.30205  ORF Transcript_10010/g.30205 Transcript_10010/m.30205 type:complete len:229 (-) Transcript_10010:247-933(-)